MGKFMVIYLCVSGLLLGFSWSLVLHAMTLEKAILIGSLRCIPIHPTFGAELVFVLPVFCVFRTHMTKLLRALAQPNSSAAIPVSPILPVPAPARSFSYPLPPLRLSPHTFPKTVHVKANNSPSPLPEVLSQHQVRISFVLPNP